MQDSRPKNLNLFTIRFPLPAIVSILHRITGVCLFLLLPVTLWLLQYSLSQEGFDNLYTESGSFLAKFMIWLCLMPLCFHLVAGIRHLLSDIHIGSSLSGGRTSAMLTFVISAIVILMMGVWLW